MSGRSKNMTTERVEVPKLGIKILFEFPSSKTSSIVEAFPDGQPGDAFLAKRAPPTKASDGTAYYKMPFPRAAICIAKLRRCSGGIDRRALRPAARKPVPPRPGGIERHYREGAWG
jgi:hypothetical protein